VRDNGLTTFAVHSNDADRGPAIAAIADDVAADGRARSVEINPGDLDPESAARRYLRRMMADPAVPELTAPPDGSGLEYRTTGSETVPLTGTTVVKFAQYLDHVPVYGSLVTVELDAGNALLAVHSALGAPSDVDPVATISPSAARDVVVDDARADAAEQRVVPRLYFYYDDRSDPPRWRLVYIVEDVLREAADTGDDETAALVGAPDVVDYVVDAHAGELVARLPRTLTMAWTPAQESATDAQGTTRSIRVERDDDGNRRLRNTVRNVRTHDFAFRDALFASAQLPGAVVGAPPDPFPGAAVSAHANAAEVARFLADVLRRDGLDNAGGPFVSSINCTYRNFTPGIREWRNAAWIGTQMIYGQRLVNGALRSYAIAKDVVAHEIMHGLTDHTARLEYQVESGALNESLSDIFGIIISNADESDVERWNWEMGEDLSTTGIPLRDLSDPTKRGQPAHMDDFIPLPAGEEPVHANDFGSVHSNSGIHNKAAHNLLTARRTNGVVEFSPAEVAALFYITVSQYLSRTSGFRDSRRGVGLATRTLFRDEPEVDRDRRLAAVGRAFDAVGIEDNAPAGDEDDPR
jgi:bacillolysin/neutral peptidase B